jgi:hypothetical protein
MLEHMTQQGFEGEKFQITPGFIVDNKDNVTDFFGDNRESWYKKLLAGGITFPRTSLDSQESFEGEDDDLPPLDPKRITENRAENIAKFFAEYPDAFQSFLEYSNTGTREKDAVESTN